MATGEFDFELQRMKYYTTVFDLSFSPCGAYLAAVDNFGRISVFSLRCALAQSATSRSRTPMGKIKVCESSLYSLLTVKNFLLCGGSNGITAWKWSDVIGRAKEGQSECQWSAELVAKNGGPAPEVNSMFYFESSSDVCVGCGDGTIRIYDLDAGLEKGLLIGHKDMVLSVTGNGSMHQLISGSEDGTVRLWDLRTNSETGSVRPAEQTSLTQPSMGPWISCVATGEDGRWMACGGGPMASLWYLRSLSLAAPLEVIGSTTHHVQFYEDQVMSAGSGGCIHHWSLNGTSKSHIPSSVGTVYSVAINSKSVKANVLAAAGSSPNIDIYTNINYRAFSLTVE
ncbi:THO complex subunit 6 homolog [Corticium candelabrum]|uniref:THO complex subunit 6 homolog n=1 Tax=Corticium candelabrum TaxID=121492 RepID=UPI002E25D55C|nr:THO complex subunit 6 homolog [Corticium candelabrum]